MAPRRLWHRRTTPATTDADLERAERLLAQAKAQRDEQQRKRDQETEGLIKPMERLAAQNHLAGWVMEIITGNGGQS